MEKFSHSYVRDTHTGAVFQFGDVEYADCSAAFSVKLLDWAGDKPPNEGFGVHRFSYDQWLSLETVTEADFLASLVLSIARLAKTLDKSSPFYLPFKRTEERMAFLRTLAEAA